MTASQAGFFSIQEFSDAGTLLVGGRVYTYAAGTTTFKTAYTDAAASVAQTYTNDGLGGQYIALNARGEIPAPLFLTAGAYDIALKRADGTTVWTRQAVPGSAASDAVSATLASSIGSSLVCFIAAGTGAVARSVQSELRERVSITQFGAVGDGTTDNSVAIQNAVNYVASRPTAGALFVPAGHFKYTVSPVVPYGVSIYGEGGTASLLEAYNCNGITIAPIVWDQGMSFFKDIGINSMAGNNFTGFQSLVPGGTGSTQDGFYISGVRMFDWDTAMLFGSTYQSYIDDCYIERVNSGIVITGDSELINITNTNIIRTGGGRGAAVNQGMFLSTPSEEAVIISGCFIYGFQTCIKTADVLFPQITDNTLLCIDATGASGEAICCIDVSGTKDHLIIERNLVEGSTNNASTTYRGIWLRPLNTSTHAVSGIRANRFISDNATGTSIGLQVNDTATTNQDNVIAEANSFIGFTGGDIIAYNVNNITLQNNQCRSTAPTSSITVTGGVTGPGYVLNNWCAKAITVDAGLLTAGTVLKSGNTESAAWVPPYLGGSWTPVDASGAGLALTVSQAKYFKLQDKVFVVQCDITWPTTANGSNASIGGMPAIPNNAYSGSVSYSTVGTWSGGVTSSTTATFGLYDTAGVPRTNAAMSGKRIIASFTFATA